MAGTVPLAITEELDSYAVLIRMVADRMADTILPFSAVATDVASGSLGWRLLDSAAEWHVVLARVRDAAETAAMTAIAALVTEAVVTSAAVNRWRALAP